MKSPSRPNEATMGAIRDVHEALSSTWNARPRALRLFGRSSSIDRAIDLIDQLDPNPQVCPHLVGLLVHPVPDVRQATARFITRSMPLLEAEALPKFESVIRSIGSYRWELRTTAINADRVDHHVLGLYSMHDSGYVRESAVKALAKAPDGLRYLLLRINDWVPAVRSLAASAISTQITQPNARRWAELLPMIVRLQGRSRADPRWVLEGIERLLLTPENRAVLFEAIQMPDHPASRAAFLMALRLTPSERVHALLTGIRSRDPVIRLQAARAIRAWTDCPDRSVLLRRLFKDKFGPVRLEVLLSQVEPAAPDRREWIESALLDRSGSVREAARFHYKRLPPPNKLQDFYSNVLESARAGSQPRLMAVALRGVKESAT